MKYRIKKKLKFFVADSDPGSGIQDEKIHIRDPA
jgi:hypothetical protein